MALMPVLVSCGDDPKEEPEQPASLTVSPSEYTFPSEGGSFNFSVTTNVDNVQVSCSASWLEAAVVGSELKVTVQTNTQLEPRSAEITLTAKDVTKKVSISQEKGEKYPGYAEMTKAGMSYQGCDLEEFAFIYGMENADGGHASLTLSTEDERYTMSIELFTTRFETAEEVCLTPGTYAKGDDDMEVLHYCGKAMTFVPGFVYIISDEEGDEEFPYGSFLYTTIGDVTTSDLLRDGSFTVEKNGDTYLIKTELKGEDGTEYKYYYEGPLEISADYAIYPSDLGGEHGDPTAVTSAEIWYNGDQYGMGNTSLTLVMYTNEESLQTMIEFNVDAITFEELEAQGLNGAFYSGEETTYESGTCNLGSSLELMGMTFAMGSYVQYGFLDYMIADGFASLVIEKQESGNYNITSGLADASFENFYMFDLKDIPVTFLNYDESDWED